MANMSELSPGMAFTRQCIALAVTRGNWREAAVFAANRWGSNSSPAIILREAIGGLEVGSDNVLYSEMGRASTAFIDMVRPRTIIGKLQNFRRVPGRTPIIKQSAKATAYWAGQGGSRPLTKAAFTYDTITPLTIAALTVMSNELLKSNDPASEQLIRNDLAKALVELYDSSFIDPLNDGVAGKTPASVTYGVTPRTATGDIANDIEALVSDFSGDLEAASFVMHPRLAVQIGLRAGSVAADLGARGGSLAGLPVITSSSANYQDSDGGHISLIDESGIVLLEEELRVRISQQATLEMDTEPTGDTLTPAGASTAHVNMFQTESSAMLVEQSINWEKARTDAVVVLAGADYPA